MKLDFDHFIFDLDGTIVNSINEIYSAAIKTCKNNNLSIPTLEYLKKKIGIHPNIFFADHGATSNLEILVKEFREILYKEAGDPTLVFDGAKILLDLLYKKNKQISLATTKPTILAKTLIERYGVSKYFSFIQGTEEGINPKPAPDMIFKCLSNNNKYSAVMIGDTVSDIKAAQAAGIEAIGVTTGACNKDDLSKSDAIMVVDNLVELIKYL